MLFDKKLQKEKRKILLFLDNAASHPRNIQLKNIKIIFLPPNTTAFCQPLDQGIIKNFKTWYRFTILKNILSKMEIVASSEELVKSINLLDVVYFIHKAWTKVTADTIRNCFRKAGFRHSGDIVSQTEFDPEDNVPLSVIAERCKIMHHTSGNSVDFEEYVMVDEDLLQEDENLDDDNMNSESIETHELENDRDEDDNLPEEEEVGVIKTNKEALLAIKNLKLFSSKSGDLKGFEMLSNLEDHFENTICAKNVRQKTILHFFQHS